MKKLLILVLVGMVGCAGLPAALSLSSAALSTIGTFYDGVQAQKTQADRMKAATLILQQADALAKQAQAGQTTQSDLAKVEVLQAQAQALE
jgi:hypothetical protein